MKSRLQTPPMPPHPVHAGNRRNQRVSFGTFLVVAGDQVYRKGALRGGHHDQRNSRLKLMNAFRAATLSRQQLQERLNGVRTKMQDILSTPLSTIHTQIRSAL